MLATPTIKTKVNLGDRSFQVAARNLWNALPRELHEISDTKIFKRDLKTHLFKIAFY